MKSCYYTMDLTLNLLILFHYDIENIGMDLTFSHPLTIINFTNPLFLAFLLIKLTVCVILVHIIVISIFHHFDI